MKPTAGFYRAAWLIVAEGGWWKPREILARIPLEIDITEANNRLWIMAHRNGFLERRGDRHHPEYAVTPKCRAPRCLSVGEIVTAVVGTPPRSSA